MATVSDLDNQQATTYNQMLIDFYKGFDVRGHLRLGQAFFNHFYGTVFSGSYPELFYCEDNHEAIDMIEVCLCDYILRGGK